MPAFTPALLNVSFIVFALWGAPYFDPPVLALAWAVFVGGVLQLAFQVPFLVAPRLLPRFRLDFSDPGVWRVLRQMGPAVFGVSIGQVSLVINNIFASFLVTGSVSWLYYADRLMEFPAGMLGVALGTILLPSLSKHHATRSADEYSRLLDWGLRITLLLAVPAAAALALLAVPLVTTLFQYGAFSAADTFATRDAVDRLQRRARRSHPRQGARAGFLRAAEHQDAGQGRDREPRRDAAHEPRARLAPASTPGSRSRSASAPASTPALLYVLLRRAGIYRPQPGWAIFTLKLGARGVRDGRGAVAHHGQRVGMARRERAGARAAPHRVVVAAAPRPISRRCGRSASD